MFAFDESIKPHLLGKLSPGSTIYFLLDRYWDQLVLYLLLSPLQWLHLTHMLYTTHWDEYSLVGKAVMMCYAATCFAFWEGARIFMYYTCRAVAQVRLG